LVEEFQLVRSGLVIYGILRGSQQRELETMAKAHEYFGIYANKGVRSSVKLVLQATVPIGDWTL
jgi:hypothetical protein